MVAQRHARDAGRTLLAAIAELMREQREMARTVGD